MRTLSKALKWKGVSYRLKLHAHSNPAIPGYVYTVGFGGNNLSNNQTTNKTSARGSDSDLDVRIS